MPSPSPDRWESRLKFELDPEKQPDTVANAEDAARKHGPETMYITKGEMSSQADKDKARKERTGGYKRVPGMALDEEPPTSISKPGQPATIKQTSEAESKSQGGKMGPQLRKLQGMPDDTIIAQEIKGKGLPGSKGKEEREEREIRWEREWPGAMPRREEVLCKGVGEVLPKAKE